MELVSVGPNLCLTVSHGAGIFGGAAKMKEKAGGGYVNRSAGASSSTSASETCLAVRTLCVTKI